MEATDEIKTEQKKYKLLWLSPLAAGLLLTLMFKAAHRFPGDTNIFLVGDNYIQLMEYIVMFWRKLFSGNGLFYSFDIGLGATAWEHYSYYGCFCPFNIVFLFINDIDTAMFVLYLLKVCAIALCMHLFLVYGMKVREGIAVLFSVPYALSSYVICFHCCVVFIDFLYILPVVMLMMIRFFRSGKAGGLTIAYAYSFLTTFYGGYMIGIFSFVCFVLMLISGQFSASKKVFLRRYISGVFTAALISGVVTVPAAMAIVLGKTGESSLVTMLTVNLADILEAMYPLTFVEVYAVQPAVYAGLIMLISLMGYILDKGYGYREKIIAGIPILFLLICTMYKPAYLLMHGFDEPDGYCFRFAFMYCFYFSAIAARWLDKKKENLSILPFALTIILESLLVLKSHFIPNEKLDEPDIITAVLVGVFVVIYYLLMRKDNKRRYTIICGIVFIELLINGYYDLTPEEPSVVRSKEGYELLNRQGNQALAKISDMEAADSEEQFYRVNYRYGLFVNDSMSRGFHGLGYFCSIEQKDTAKFMKNMGYSTSNRTLEEKGGSPFTEMILAQKYKVIADPNKNDKEHDDAMVEQNECVLPIAFMVSDQIKGVQNDKDVFMNQQQVLNAMVGHETKIWNGYSGAVYLNCNNATIGRTDEGFDIKRTEPGSAEIIFTIPTEDSGDFYSYVQAGWNGMRETSPVVYSDAEDEMVGQVYYSLLYMPAMIRLESTEEKGNLYIEMREEDDDEADFEKIIFADFHEEGLYEAYEELKPGGMKIEKMKDDDICGQITVSGEKNVMFTSIPYDENWYIVADGKETETFSVLDGAFLACSLSEGEHDIRIYYDNKYIKTGALISACGLLFLCGQCLWVNGRKKEEDNT